MPRPMPLLAPDIARMAVIESQLAAVTPRLRELEARIEAVRGRRDAAMHRLYDVDHEEAIEAELRDEFAGADRAWQAAVEAWRAAEGPAFALREEWLQLQVVRSFMPRCAMCDGSVVPAYLELGRDRDSRALCLDCFDGWASDHDSESDRRPPSHWLTLTAKEARERETARRQESAEGRRSGSSARPCWHCGGPAGDLEDQEARVVFKVAAVVPTGTSPEVGEVCLICLDWDVELLGRWQTIERDLCDPASRRHEGALQRFIRDGPRDESERRKRSRTAAVRRTQTAVAYPQASPARRTAGR